MVTSVSFLTACRFTAASAGIGDFVYSTLVTGYSSPSGANALNGSTYHFRAESLDLTQWEETEGIYASASGTFSRTTVLYNSSGTGTKQSGAGTKIDFLAPPQVAVTYLAEDIVPPTSSALARAWGQLTQSGGVYSNLASFNVGSFSKTSTGIVVINLSVPFSSANYALLISVNQTAGAIIQEVFSNRTASSFAIQMTSSSTGALLDSGFSFVAFGSQ